MKRIFTLVLVALFVAGQTATAQTIWDGTTDTEWLGTGTQADPYQISTPQELAGVAELVNNGTTDFAGEYICLTADIYLHKEDTPDSLKREWPRIGGITRSQHGEFFQFDSTIFRGNFDGRDHTVYGVYCGTMPSDTTNWDNPFESFYVDFSGWERGFFGYLENATVENLKLHKMMVMGGSIIGGLSPYALNSTIRNVHITESAVGSSLGDYGGGAGGLVGQLMGCLVEDCTVDARLQGTRSVGVLAGISDSETVIRNCSTSGYAYMSQYTCGGFVGGNDGLIERCSSSADVSRGYYSYAFTSGAPDCAGFAGGNTGIIRDCFATGNVVNTTLEGHGFCGRNTGRLESCYATGNIEGHTPITVTAFCGQNGLVASDGITHPGEIINCFGTGQCTITDPDQPYAYYHGFIATAETSFSMIANGYFDSEKNPNGNNCTGGSFGVTTEYMKSQAFVDTLNMVAALKGLTKWQYNPGGYPTLTNEKATNITDYLAGGAGTKEDPYRIETKEHLKNFAKYVNHGYHFAGDYLLQTKDIVMNPPFEKWSEEAPEVWQTIGRNVKTQIVGNTNEYNYSFRGTYDGGLHEIQNLYCYSLTTVQGLFGFLHHDANIRNLGVTDAWVLGSSNSGILAAVADRYATNIDIRNCWTSGTIEDKGWGAGGILGTIALEGNNNILNCFSNAKIHGVSFTKPVVGDQNYIGGETWSNDTVGNFFYYGKTSEMYYASAGYELTRNFFFNKDSVDECAELIPLRVEQENGYSTEYLYSKEFVNDLNYWVSQWNETHAADPLYYWEYRENDYPFYTTSVPEHHTITFAMNGGSYCTPQIIVPESKIVLPATPTKEGNTFMGWYSDETLEQLYDTATIVNTDMTLYAKWSPDYVPDYSIFTNPFATSYIIKTKEQLIAFAHVVNGTSGVVEATSFEGKTVRLGADILLNDTSYWTLWGKHAYATPWVPIGLSNALFQGTFEGQGYTISGMYCSDPNARYVGLFGYVGDKAIIRDVTINASHATGNQDVSLLIANNSGIVTNCNVSGKIRNANMSVGLLIGAQGDKGKVTDCHAQGDIYGRMLDRGYSIGGLIGTMGYGNHDTLYHCSADVDILYIDQENHNIGGLVGSLNHIDAYGYDKNVRVVNCYAMGDISSKGKYIGGLVGYTKDVIDSCYATGNVFAGNEFDYDVYSLIGGLVGESVDTIKNSYATGNVTGGAEVGGLVGKGVALSNCHATGEVRGYRKVGGLAAIIEGNIVRDCYATGNVTALQSFVENMGLAGGLIGQLGACSVLRCWASGDVFGVGSAGGLIGGENGTGMAYMTINQCYALGDVTSIGMHDDNAAGGIYGGSTASRGTFTDCFAMGKIQAPKQYAGICSNGYNKTFTNCYFAGELVPMEGATCGPILANLADYAMINNSYFDNDKVSSTLSYGRSTAQMKQASTFSGWDFEEIWGINPNYNDGYPYLRFALGASNVDILMLSANNVVLLLGETKQLTVHAPESVQGTIVWESGNTAIATVDNGLITPVAYGRTYVVAHTIDNTLSDTCWVQVACPPTGVVISEQIVYMLKNSTYQLSATVLPIEADQKVTWSDSDSYSTPRFEVDVNGLLHSKDYTGTWKVFATTADGKYRDTCEVHVVESANLPVKSITLSHQEMILANGETATITATVLPEGAMLASYNWRSTDQWGVAYLDVVGNTATITARGAGTALIIVEKDGVGDTCTVTVTDPSRVSSVELDVHKVTIEVGKTHQLNATIFPATAENKDLLWSTDDRNVARVRDGLITARSIGTTKVWCETWDGGFTDTCYVTVVEEGTKPEPTVIALSAEALTTKAGETLTITATITSGDTEQAITWFSSNDSIATVASDSDDNIATVTAVAAGTVTITATTADGASASCEVTVEDSSTSAVEYLQDNSKPSVRKVFERGSIYIIRNGKKYTIDGRMIN